MPYCVIHTPYTLHLFFSEMPDTKAEDEVDFLSKIGSSSDFDQVTVGNGATTPKMKQGPETHAVSDTSKTVWA